MQLYTRKLNQALIRSMKPNPICDTDAAMTKAAANSSKKARTLNHFIFLWFPCGRLENVRCQMDSQSWETRLIDSTYETIWDVNRWTADESKYHSNGNEFFLWKWSIVESARKEKLSISALITLMIQVLEKHWRNWEHHKSYNCDTPAKNIEPRWNQSVGFKRNASEERINPHGTQTSSRRSGFFYGLWRN